MSNQTEDQHLPEALREYVEHMQDGKPVPSGPAHEIILRAADRIEQLEKFFNKYRDIQYTLYEFKEALERSHR